MNIYIVCLFSLSENNHEGSTLPIADPAEPAGLRVFKRGNATCLTEGVLCGIRESVNILLGSRQFFFNKCFVVGDLQNSSHFFKEGDSGSGVFVLDKPSQRLKALGIGFAISQVSGETFVCKLSHICRDFNLSLSEEIFAKKIERDEIDMETS